MACISDTRRFFSEEPPPELHSNCFPKANLPKMNFTQEKYIDNANKESKADQGCPKSLEVLTSMVTTKATKGI